MEVNRSILNPVAEHRTLDLMCYLRAVYQSPIQSCRPLYCPYQ